MARLLERRELSRQDPVPEDGVGHYDTGARGVRLSCRGELDMTAIEAESFCVRRAVLSLAAGLAVAVGIAGCGGSDLDDATDGATLSLIVLRLSGQVAGDASINQMFDTTQELIEEARDAGDGTAREALEDAQDAVGGACDACYEELEQALDEL